MHQVFAEYNLMNSFVASCKRCLNPWIIGVIIVVVIALLIFVPIIGVASLLAALPLIFCTAMCGGMMFMMGKGNEKK